MYTRRAAQEEESDLDLMETLSCTCRWGFVHLERHKVGVELEDELVEVLQGDVELRVALTEAELRGGVLRRRWNTLS